VGQIYCMVVTCSRRLYNILYFLWLYNEFFIILYNILKIAELDCFQIIILSIYVPSTHVLRLSLNLPYKNLTALKSNSNTVWFNFQTYIYISVERNTVVVHVYIQICYHCYFSLYIVLNCHTNWKQIWMYFAWIIISLLV
jgi:hypothetical protein